MGEAVVVSTGQWGPCQVTCKLTWILISRSLVQALLTVLSQVLCFLTIEWYLPLLMSSLVLGWLNLLYYTRGFQHTGIYSVMIQKVRGRSGPTAARLGIPGSHTPVGLPWASTGTFIHS